MLASGTRMSQSIHLQGKRLVLASKSPRRAELLTQAGVTFTVRLPTFEEDLGKEGLDPAQYARATALAKGQNVFDELGEDDVLVLAADTIVEGYPGEVWEKPKDEAEARSMLKSLSNRTHDVHTGVAFVCSREARSIVVTTSVKFLELDDLSVENYVQSGSPLDKAGAYGIQDMWMVESISGDYFNVVGLPVSRVLRELKELDSK